MKNILLLRHAKSSWDNPDLADFDRPLNPRGMKAARIMGTWLAQQQMIPNYALLSAAKRCQQTWEIVSGALPADVETQPAHDLYMAHPDVILEKIQCLSASLRCVIVINHEPTISGLAYRLAAQPVSQNVRQAFDKFPTAALAVFTIDTEDWHSIDYGQCNFARFVTPKSLI